MRRLHRVTMLLEYHINTRGSNKMQWLHHLKVVTCSLHNQPLLLVCRMSPNGGLNALNNCSDFKTKYNYMI